MEESEEVEVRGLPSVDVGVTERGRGPRSGVSGPTLPATEAFDLIDSFELIMVEIGIGAAEGVEVEAEGIEVEVEVEVEVAADASKTRPIPASDTNRFAGCAIFLSRVGVSSLTFSGGTGDGGWVVEEASSSRAAVVGETLSRGACSAVSESASLPVSVSVSPDRPARASGGTMAIALCGAGTAGPAGCGGSLIPRRCPALALLAVLSRLVSARDSALALLPRNRSRVVRSDRLR